MKKLLLLLLFIPLVSFGQTAEEYYQSGYDKDEAGDYKGAIADYTKAIELNPNPNYADTYFSRGFAKYNLNDYNGAIADYTKVIELNPNYADAYFSRGLSKSDLKDLTGACADWKKAASLGYTNSAESVANQCN